MASDEEDSKSEEEPSLLYSDADEFSSSTAEAFTDTDAYISSDDENQQSPLRPTGYRLADIDSKPDLDNTREGLPESGVQFMDKTLKAIRDWKSPLKEVLEKKLDADTLSTTRAREGRSEQPSTESPYRITWGNSKRNSLSPSRSPRHPGAVNVLPRDEWHRVAEQKARQWKHDMDSDSERKSTRRALRTGISSAQSTPAPTKRKVPKALPPSAKNSKSILRSIYGEHQSPVLNNHPVPIKPHAPPKISKRIRAGAPPRVALLPSRSGMASVPRSTSSASHHPRPRTALSAHHSTRAGDDGSDTDRPAWRPGGLAPPPGMNTILPEELSPEVNAGNKPQFPFAGLHASTKPHPIVALSARTEGSTPTTDTMTSVRPKSALVVLRDRDHATGTRSALDIRLPTMLPEEVTPREKKSSRRKKKVKSHEISDAGVSPRRRHRIPSQIDLYDVLVARVESANLLGKIPSIFPPLGERRVAESDADKKEEK